MIYPDGKYSLAITTLLTRPRSHYNASLIGRMMSGPRHTYKPEPDGWSRLTSWLSPFLQETTRLNCLVSCQHIFSVLVVNYHLPCVLPVLENLSCCPLRHANRGHFSVILQLATSLTTQLPSIHAHGFTFSIAC